MFVLAIVQVSVRGAVLALRVSRSAKQRGSAMPNDSNVLRDGSLIDLCGVTLLYRTKEGLSHSPVRSRSVRLFFWDVYSQGPRP